MKKLIFNLGLITILSINIILILGGGVTDFEKIEKFFGIVVMILEISIIPTAVYYFIKNLQFKNSIFTWLFGIVNLCYIVAWGLYFIGIAMPRILLYVFDVYALNLYLSFYIIHWNKLSSNQF